ncbi:hypothetical protein ONZ45_g5047 [Pleurotus djamor]|nr:hypothetical protein ONZ45_g5047 [Pleurotus djamor]
MTMEIAGVVAYRRIKATERHTSACWRWQSVSPKIATFANVIKPTSEFEADYNSRVLECELPPLAKERFSILLEELSVALGLYETPDSSAPDSDGDGENVPLVHARPLYTFIILFPNMIPLLQAPDQFISEDSLEPPAPDIFKRIRSLLKDLPSRISSKFVQGTPDAKRSWLAVIIDLDKEVREARRSGLINNKTRDYLKSVLDEIVDYYHKVLKLNPYAHSLPLWCATMPIEILEAGAFQTILCSIFVSLSYTYQLVTADVYDFMVNKCSSQFMPPLSQAYGSPFSAVNHPSSFFDYYSHDASGIVLSNIAQRGLVSALRELPDILSGTPAGPSPRPPSQPTNGQPAREARVWGLW